MGLATRIPSQSHTVPDSDEVETWHSGLDEQLLLARRMNSRLALTPVPSPTLRERGDVGTLLAAPSGESAEADLVLFQMRFQPPGQLCGRSVGPFPVADFRHVLAALNDVRPVFDALVAGVLAQIGRSGAESGNPVNDIHHQVVAIQIVADDHIERRGGRASLLVAAH